MTVQVLEQAQEPLQEQEQEPVQEQVPGPEWEADGFAAPALRWEPCGEASTLDEHGLCAGCGWPPDDHGVGTPEHRAVVIRVPERPRLRRAS